MPVLVNGIVIGLELTFVFSGSFNLPIFLTTPDRLHWAKRLPALCWDCRWIRALEKTGLGNKLFADSALHKIA